MKIIIFYIFIFFSVSLCAFDVESIIKKIENMEASNNTYDKINYEIYNPFATAKPIVKKSTTSEIVMSRPFPIVLKTILNEKAFINNHWYSVGDVFREYKIQAIHKSLVVLAKESELKIINMNALQSKINIKTKELN